MKTLDEWLRYIEQQHPKAIALGLERSERGFTGHALEVAGAIAAAV